MATHSESENEVLLGRALVDAHVGLEEVLDANSAEIEAAARQADGRPESSGDVCV